MPKNTAATQNLTASDALEFSKRLKEAMADVGLNTARGAGTYLSRRYKVSVYTGNSWLNGTNKPEQLRARDLARDLVVNYDWLYFGDGPKRSAHVAETSQPYAKDLPLTPEEIEHLRAYRAADQNTRNGVDLILKHRK